MRTIFSKTGVEKEIRTVLMLFELWNFNWILPFKMKEYPPLQIISLFFNIFQMILLRNISPPRKIETPKICTDQKFVPITYRCTMKNVPIFINKLINYFKDRICIRCFWTIDNRNIWLDFLSRNSSHVIQCLSNVFSVCRPRSSLKTCTCFKLLTY